MRSISYYRTKLVERGVDGIIVGRWRWYKQSFQMNNWFVGRLVELFGNKISIDGITLSVDNPLVMTSHKGSMYFGIYEMAERQLSRALIDRSLPTLEIGGSIGGVACVTNKLLDNPSAHVVVECNPKVLPTLKKNRELNHCQFSIEAAAIAYGSDTISFTCDPSHFMLGTLHNNNGAQITVKTTTLKSILDKYEFGIINLISDSEGAEVEMVENELDLLQRNVKCLIMEKHTNLRGSDAIAATLRALENVGFETVAEQEQTVGMINKHLR